MSAPDGRGPARRAFDWWFRDRRTGRITIAQAPNAPLVLGVGLATGAAVAGRTGADPRTAAALRTAASASLAWWAIREAAEGVNPWRRLLGVATLTGLALDRRRSRASE